MQNKRRILRKESFGSLIVDLDKSELFVGVNNNSAEVSDALSYPLNITIYPTYKCQLNCSFCFMKSIKNNDEPECSLNDFKKIIDEMEILKIPYLSILGGEPFLYSHLESVISYIKRKNINCTITTKGLLLKKEVLNLINDNISLTISIYSLDDYNKKYMGVAYRLITNSITKLKSRCSVNVVFFDQNLSQLLELVEFCKNENVKTLSISLYNNCRQDLKEDIDRLLIFKRLKQRIDNYIKEKMIKIDIRFAGCCQYLVYDKIGKLPKSAEEVLFSKCEAGITKLEILPNGDTMPCMAMQKERFRSGNVFKTSIKQVWETDRVLQELRKNKVKDYDCIWCKYSNFCNGGCPARRYNDNKDILTGRDRRCLAKK